MIQIRCTLYVLKVHTTVPMVSLSILITTASILIPKPMSIDRDTIGTVVMIREHGRLWDHYGILDGLCNVIHVHKHKGSICKDPLHRFISKAKTINCKEEDFDTRFKRYRMAEALVGSKYQYSIFSNNCETWVNLVSGSIIDSQQVHSLCKTIATWLVGYTAIAAIMDE